MLNSISKPPGSAPPFIPFKPVPRLVPLPSRHTLPVQQPNRFKLSNFGHLREENLQMVLLARRITQQLVDIRYGRSAVCVYTFGDYNAIRGSSLISAFSMIV